MTCRNFFHDLNSKCQQLEFNKFQISGVRGQFLQVLNSNSHLIFFFKYLKNYFKIIFFLIQDQGQWNIILCQVQLSLDV